MGLGVIVNVCVCVALAVIVGVAIAVSVAVAGCGSAEPVGKMPPDSTGIPTSRMLPMSATKSATANIDRSRSLDLPVIGAT